MATTKEGLKKELKAALKEVGPIKPWFDKEVNSWIFESPLYPVEYAGDTVEDVVKNYPKYLEVFIEHRMAGKIDLISEKKTKGKGGARPGAGRPKGALKEPTKQIRVPLDIATWLNHPGIFDHIRQMIKAYPAHRESAQNSD